MRVVVGAGDPTDGLFNDVSALTYMRLPVALGAGKDAASKRFSSNASFMCVFSLLPGLL